MKTLAIDIETFSGTDLKKSGVYRYAQDPDFTILLIAYSIDDEPVELLDLTAEQVPESLIKALTDPSIIKTAHNANFERTCLTAFFGLPMSPEQWRCTMATAAQVGLPLSLEACAKVLGLQQQKDTAGKALIRYFCVPCKPTKTNGERIRNLPHHDPAKWEAFKEYCRQDVVVEQAIREKISWFDIPQMEVDLWNLDQRINDRGVLADPQMVANAIKIDKAFREQLTAEAIQITGLDNPNSVAQLKGWLKDAAEIEVETLNKEATSDLIKIVGEGPARRVLEIRQKMSKSSVKKYDAVINCIGSDGRVRGLLQYYGANRTGRWAGRLVQVQNLPRNEMNDLALAREIVKDGDGDLLEMCFGSVSDVLSQLIRTSFVAPDGHSFIVADFSAIEARVLAWLAGEKWRLQVFETHGKIYEASASQMFKIPLEKITKGSDLRQKGKVAELALGYQGGPGALEKMGAIKMGIPVEELPRLVKMWRNANPKIVKYWYDVEAAAMEAINNPGQTINLHPGLKFYMKKGALLIELPSGRRLCYLRAKIGQGSFGSDCILFEGMNQTTKQWGRQDTYGGKLVENITQAVARDCLADALLRIDKAGFQIAMHIHDEAVLEDQREGGVCEEVDKIMGTPIPWAKGLPLKAESYITKFYKKD